MYDMTRSKIEINKKDKINMLLEFYNTFKRPPKNTEVYKGVNIGSFYHNIKQGNTKISESDLLRLKQAGIKTETKDIKKLNEERVLLIVEFFKENNRAPKYKDTYKGEKIGYFLNNIRQSNSRISNSDKKLLESLGIRTTAKKHKKYV